MALGRFTETRAFECKTSSNNYEGPTTFYIVHPFSILPTKLKQYSNSANVTAVRKVSVCILVHRIKASSTRLHYYSLRRRYATWWYKQRWYCHCRRRAPIFPFVLLTTNWERDGFSSYTIDVPQTLHTQKSLKLISPFWITFITIIGTKNRINTPPNHDEIEISESELLIKQCCYYNGRNNISLVIIVARKLSTTHVVLYCLYVFSF